MLSVCRATDTRGCVSGRVGLYTRDVLEDLGVQAPATRPRRDASVTDAATDDPLLALIGHDPVDLDTIAKRSGRAASELSAALLELELAQHIERLPGNRYQRLG